MTIACVIPPPPPSPAAYARGLLSQGIQMLPQGRRPQLLGGGAGVGVATPLPASSAPAEMSDDHIRLDKSNIILLGPTGCGELKKLTYINDVSIPPSLPPSLPASLKARPF